MSREYEFVAYFYETYQGRISFSAGYGRNLDEIFPFVFTSAGGNSIGVIALDVIKMNFRVVHIYHIGAFISGHGDGNTMLKEICRKADEFKITLTVSPVALPNGDNGLMNSNDLSDWYKKFGFRNESGLVRKPVQQKER